MPLFQVQTNALMSASEVAQGTRYTEALTTSWRPPKHYRDMTEDDCDKLREKWSILVDVRWLSWNLSGFFKSVQLILPGTFLCLTRPRKRARSTRSTTRPERYRGREEVSSGRIGWNDCCLVSRLRYFGALAFVFFCFFTRDQEEKWRQGKLRPAERGNVVA